MQSGKPNLVEVVAVVCGLGLIGALTVPRFTQARQSEADRPDRREQLRVVRCAIELYRQDHGCFPGQRGDGQNEPGSAALLTQLTYCTDAEGRVSALPSNVYCFGPYLRGGWPGGRKEAPSMLVIHGPDTPVYQADAPVEWIYNCDTGQIIANSPPDEETQ